MTLYLCKSCYEYAKIQGMYKDRGDPAAHDWQIGDFIKDFAWHVLDLSAIVPENAKAVLFRVSVRADVVAATWKARKNGNVNTIAMSVCDTQVAFVVITYDVVVSCDENRIVEYNADNVPFTLINVSVKGWWF